MDSKKEVARLQKKVGKWLKEWLVNPVLIKGHSATPQAGYQDHLDNKEESIYLGLYSQKFHFWHLIQYEHAVLNKGGDGLKDLALAVRYAEACVRFEEAFANGGENGSLLQDEAVLYFSLAILAGWKDVAGRIGKALVQGLDTSLLDLRHTDRHCKGVLYRHFWFVLHLYEQISGDRFDIKNYSYPSDMAPYSEVLTDWKTTDLTKVHNWVYTLADFHVQESRNMSHDQIDEFDTESTMIFPYEILCWLRLREWAGLANPDSFAHPLMHQALAKLPSPVPLAMPEVPLLDQVIAKFRQEYPNSFL